MDGKRRALASDKTSTKRQRKNISLEVKADVIQRYERGERAVDIGRALGLAESTLRTIRANAEKIKAGYKTAIPSITNKKITVKRPPASKKHRKFISLKVKADVIKRYERGERGVDIGRALGLKESTLRTIRANAEKIKASYISATPIGATKTGRIRSVIMERMERLLSAWIEQQNQRKVPLSYLVIQEKAKAIYRDLKAEYGDEYDAKPFFASHGWFHRFKKRRNLLNIKMTGDTEADDFSELLKKLIKEGGYSAKQVFGVYETGLYWKRIPTKNTVSQENTASDLKSSNDCCMLLLGGNAEGDYKLKPLMLYHSETPVALRRYSKDHKSWATAAVFLEWLTVHLHKEAKEYCARENIEFKILLIIYNAPCYPPNLIELSENIKIIFLPPNSPLIQPMCYVATSFKAYYLCQVFAKLLRERDGEGKLTTKEFWQNFNIEDAINVICESWAEVTPPSMNKVWQEMWSEYICDSTDFNIAEDMLNVKLQIIGLAKEIGFNEVDMIDVEELLESHNELSNEELPQDELFAKENEITDVEPIDRMLTTKRLSKAFHLIQEGLKIFDEDDPNRQRSSTVASLVNGALCSYHQLYKEKAQRATQKLQNSIWLSLDRIIKSRKKVSV